MYKNYLNFKKQRKQYAAQARRDDEHQVQMSEKKNLVLYNLRILRLFIEREKKQLFV